MRWDEPLQAPGAYLQLAAAKRSWTQRHPKPLPMSHGLSNHTERDVSTLAKSMTRKRRTEGGRRGGELYDTLTGVMSINIQTHLFAY